MKLQMFANYRFRTYLLNFQFIMAIFSQLLSNCL